MMDSWIAYLLIVMVAGLFWTIGWLVWCLALTSHANPSLSGVERITVKVLLQERSYTNDGLDLVAVVKPGESWQDTAAALRREADRLIRRRWAERREAALLEQAEQDQRREAARLADQARREAEHVERKGLRDAHVTEALAAGECPCPDCPAEYCSDCPCPEEQRAGDDIPF